MLHIFAILLVAYAALSPGAASETVPGSFAPNPGNLLMFKRVPEGLAPDAPLVVALHGCTQGAEEFDDESGWADLAERLGFALLLPQQRQANNSARCFNFFSADHNRRGRGEAASIAAMIQAIQDEHGTDPGRVYVTGLSAGGAMAAVMIAAYPDVVKAGAVFAGVPYGCADTGGNWLLAVQRYWWTITYGEAAWASHRCGIDRTGFMHTPPAPRSPQEWRGLLAAAGAPEPSNWPSMSLWHGNDDRTVHPLNLDELVKQWTAAHGADQVPDRERTTSLYRHREYRNDGGETVVEAFEVDGLAHAVPVAPGDERERCGRAVAPHFVDRGICAAYYVARFWKLDAPR